MRSRKRSFLPPKVTEIGGHRLLPQSWNSAVLVALRVGFGSKKKILSTVLGSAEALDRLTSLWTFLHVHDK